MISKIFKMPDGTTIKLQRLADIMTHGNQSECVRQLIDDKFAALNQTFHPQSETIAQTFLREQSGWKPADELREDGEK